jgi:septum site-determining protein MinC
MLTETATAGSPLAAAAAPTVVVVGDVNPGASVCAKGNVVVLGCAKGYLSAGCDGDDHAFVAALDMQPMQIRIGKHIARSADGEPEKKKKLFGRSKNNDNQPMEAQIASDHKYS